MSAKALRVDDRKKVRGGLRSYQDTYRQSYKSCMVVIIIKLTCGSKVSQNIAYTIFCAKSQKAENFQDVYFSMQEYC